METKRLNTLTQHMKDKGFDVRMAFVNRLRILDMKISSFGQTSDPVKESMNMICNQTYNEMYENPAQALGDDTLRDAKTRAKRFEEIYDGLTEFSKLSPTDRKKFIAAKKPHYIQPSLFTKKMLDQYNGHA